MMQQLGPLLGLGDAVELEGDRRTESFAAWRRFFEGLAELDPLVLVFEDLHWADEGLLDFVDHLVDWAGRRSDPRRRNREAGASRPPSRLGRRQAECRDDLAVAADGGGDGEAASRPARACRPSGRGPGPVARPRGWQSALRRGVREIAIEGGHGDLPSPSPCTA